MTPDPDVSRDSEEILRFAREELGPQSQAALSDPAAHALIRSRKRGGVELTDAILAQVHGLATTNSGIADEFVAFFMRVMMQMGQGQVAPGLRRFLDTGDLVQSVLGDLWPELASLKFETRAQFLSLLAQRIRWKASDRNREMRSGKRREDMRTAAPPEELSVGDGAPSPRTQLGDEEEQQRLILALMKLPERDRRILTLYMRGVSTENIAEDLGLGIWAARKALQRAMQRARDSVQ